MAADADTSHPDATPALGDEDPAGRDGRGGSVERAGRGDRLELIAAILLAAATVIAAWAAYQATRWSGEQARDYSLAAARRTDAAQAASVFAAEALIDVQTWLSWLQLRTQQDAQAAAFLEERLRDEFKPAFEEWLDQVPAGEIPPGTPFEMKAYESVTEGVVIDLNDEADALATQAARANQLSDDFVLVAVIMAGVLFCAGIATRFEERRLRQGLLGLAVVLLAGGLAFTFSLPQSISI